MKGKYIVIEGGEGSGKMDQITLLKDNLIKLDYNVEVVREPGGTERGEIIRDVLLNPKYEGELSAEQELLLFMFNRIDLIERKIKPFVNSGYFVLSDRDVLSSYAYQGYGGGVSLEDIDGLTRFSLKEFKPDLRFVIDVDAETGLAMATSDYKKGDKIGGRNLEYHMRVNEGYRELGGRFPDTIYIPYLKNRAEEMHEIILGHVLESL